MKTHRRSLAARILIWVPASVGILALLIVALLCAATLWLTPERLTRIVNKEASEALEADVHASNVRFTLWSSFPHLVIKADSLNVRSRTLDSIPGELRRQLPPNASFLLSTGSLEGGINLLKLASGQVWLKDVDVSGLNVNLVAVTDSINNFDIVPPSGTKTRVPYIHVQGLSLHDSGKIVYRSIPSQTIATVDMTGAVLEPEKERNRYDLKLGGFVSARSGGLDLLHNFPFSLSGHVNVNFDPFRISTTGYRIDLGHVRGHMDMAMTAGSKPGLDSFAYSVDNFNLHQLLTLLPPGMIPDLKGLEFGADVTASARLRSPYLFSSAWLPSIEVDFEVPDGHISYTLADGSSYTADRITMQGRFLFDGRDPAASRVEIPSLKLSGMGADIDINGTISDLTNEPRIEAGIKGLADLGNMGTAIEALKPMDLKGSIHLDTELEMAIRKSGLEISPVTLHASSPMMSINSDNCRMDLRGFKADATAIQKGSSLGTFTASIKAAQAKITSPATRASLGAISLNTEIAPRQVKDTAAARPVEAHADARQLALIRHTPEVLAVSLPEVVRKLLDNWEMRAGIGVGNGSLRIRGYGSESSLRNLKAEATMDSVVLKSLWIASGSTSGYLKGKVAGLHRFMTGNGPAPLDFSLHANLDTLQANQLARFYAAANPESSIARGDRERMGEGDNSLTILIPRNLRGHFHVTASALRYINLHLSDLLADGIVAGGRLDLDTLHLASTFGKAGADFHLDTSHIESMRLQAGIAIDSIDFKGFCANFPDLVARMPTLANLSGDLSAHVNARARIFPNMCLNIPSLWADAHIDALDLRLEQDPAVRHVTKMLLLPDETLDFADIRVHAGVHDNLLEVFPFNFEVSRYKLMIQGLNNFDGDIYYHVGVDHWPLRIPFGVNVKGHYHHPQFRFGGKEWHDGNGALVTAGVEDYDRVNLMKEFRTYGGELVHTAASYKGE